MPASPSASGSTLELGLSLPLETPSLEEAASYAMMVSHLALDDATYRSCAWLVHHHMSAQAEALACNLQLHG